MSYQKDYIFVYITTNIVNGKQYIGMHITDNFNDEYLGSGKALKKAFSKYGYDNFTREILNFYHDEFSAHADEEKFILQYNTLSPNGYNISPTGGLKLSGRHSEESKLKIGESRKGKTINKGISQSKDHIRKRSESMKGKPSPLKGKPWTEARRIAENNTRNKL